MQNDQRILNVHETAKKSDFKTSLSIAVFFVFLSMFLMYLTLEGKNQNPSILLFWAPLLAITSLVTYQMFYLFREGLDRKKEILLLSEFISLVFAFHAISVIPNYGFVGGDVYHEWAVAEQIRLHGWPVPSDYLVESMIGYAKWPFIHHFLVIISEVAGIPLFVTIKWSPLFYTPLSYVFLYIMIKKAYRNNSKVALLALFGFSAFNYSVLSLYAATRESLAYLFFFMVLYLLFRSLHSSDASRSGTKLKIDAIRIFPLIAVVISHHLTTFLLILAFLSMLISSMTAKSFRYRKQLSVILLLVTIVSLSYWIYIGTFVIKTLYHVGQDIINTKALTNLYGKVLGEPDLRVQIRDTGLWIYAFIFGAMIIYEALVSRKREKIVASFAVIFSFTLFLMNRMTLWIVHYVNPGKFQVLAWTGLITVASYNIIKRRRQAFILLISIFIVFNIFSISPYLYDHSVDPNYRGAEMRKYWIMPEYEAAYWLQNGIKEKGVIVSDEYMGEFLSAFTLQKSVSDKGIFLGTLTNINNYRWVIFRKEMYQGVEYSFGPGARQFAKTTRTEHSKLALSTSISLIYSNGEVEIYKNTHV